MKTLRTLAMALLGLTAMFVLVGLVLPRRWHVERSIVIAAPAARIHPFLSSPRRWQEWQTQTKDPAAKITYGVRDEGVGAERTWIGPKLGQGKMKIVSSEPATGVVVAEALQSDEPNARATFALAPEAGGTRLTWTEDGVLPLVMGGYFRPMVERSLEPQFEAGLAKLKAVVEALPPLEVPVAVPLPLPLDAGEPGAPAVGVDAGS